MGYREFPLILSPSLGCPQIISLSKGGEPVTAIIASKDDRFGQWSLVPSSSNQYHGLNKIALIQEGVEEITHHSVIPSSVKSMMDSISRELLDVLGCDIRIFKVKLSLSESEVVKLLRKVNGSFRPTMYDLSLEGKSCCRKPHAVCLIEANGKDLNFIHLTDLHLARRNDLMEGEISNAIGPLRGFNNFNDNMRAFINKANDDADGGRLDMVVISGDIVDFVNHGVSDRDIEVDNNWHVCIEILTGGACEPQKNNYGIRVPVFTSTGNHDWRLHPYDIANTPQSFGLNYSQAKNFDFEYYDTAQRLRAKNDEVYENIIKEGSPISKENLLHTAVKWFLRKSITWQAKTLIPLVSAALSSVLSGSQSLIAILPAITFMIAAGLHYGINLFLSQWVRYMVTHGVIPIEADVKALHHYFLHINPYFNYAFSYGQNYFIVMDTGPDCFVGQYLWDDGNKKMARMSINDNILGGSPDSMAFYPLNEYYSYNQIVWLEKVLKAIESADEAHPRIFIFLHAPPANVKKQPAMPGKEVLLKEGVVDVRYGTINHFLSQFYHLCLGKKENDPAYAGPKVDIVFSGHAHQEIEFRIADGPLVYTGRYSDTITHATFDEQKPFLAQTAACGPLSSKFLYPPYCRKVHIDKNGIIHSFEQSKIR